MAKETKEVKQELDWNKVFQKAILPALIAGATAVITYIQSGELNWAVIITGGIIAAATSFQNYYKHK